MGIWDELIDDGTEVRARCKGCDWSREGWGYAACREILAEADSHTREGVAHMVAVDAILESL